MLIPLLLGMAALPSSIMLVQSPVPRVADGQAVTVSHMVSGILSFVHWPSPPANIQLCVAGQPAFAGRFGEMAQASDHAITVRWVGVNDAAVARAGCDALYLGRMEDTQAARWIAWARGQAIATIAEHDPGCRGGAMFCLDVRMDGVSFALNLDAISRGGVRVDPKILVLSRRGSERGQ